MTVYSGRTTASQHKRDDWASYDGRIPAALRMERVFSCQWTDCPVEIEEEVRQLWQEQEFGNDNFYYSWDSESEYCFYPDTGEEIEETTHKERFPLIDEYLRERGIVKCLIHWWW